MDVSQLQHLKGVEVELARLQPAVRADAQTRRLRQDPQWAGVLCSAPEPRGARKRRLPDRIREPVDVPLQGNHTWSADFMANAL